MVTLQVLICVHLYSIEPLLSRSYQEHEEIKVQNSTPSHCVRLFSPLCSNLSPNSFAIHCHKTSETTVNGKATFRTLPSSLQFARRKAITKYKISVPFKKQWFQRHMARLSPCCGEITIFPQMIQLLFLSNFFVVFFSLCPLACPPAHVDSVRRWCHVGESGDH